MDVEQRLQALEERVQALVTREETPADTDLERFRDHIDEVYATGMLGLRMMVDFYSSQVSLGAADKDQVKAIWRHSAMAIGEGVPHIETRVRNMVETLIGMLDVACPDDID